MGGANRKGGVQGLGGGLHRWSVGHRTPAGEVTLNGEGEKEAGLYGERKVSPFASKLRPTP